MLTPWKKSCDKPRQHITKQRHYFANKDPCSQSYGFSSNHVWMFKLDLERAEEPEIKLPTSIGSSKKHDSFRKTSTSALLTTPKPLTMWITKNWKILKEMGMPDHLTCLLRNLYAGQEATVRTGHGTTDWFQIGKEYLKPVYCHPAYLTSMQSTS